MSRKSEIELTNMCDLAVGMAEQTVITKEFVEERASEVVAIVEAIHKIAVEKG